MTPKRNTLRKRQEYQALRKRLLALARKWKTLGRASLVYNPATRFTYTLCCYELRAVLKGKK